MASAKGSVRICKMGHQYYKSSDCPTCPTCEKNKKPGSGLLSLLSAPARRAFEREKILTVETLAKWTETDILALHGVGPGSLPVLKKALKENKLSFRNLKN